MFFIYDPSVMQPVTHMWFIGDSPITYPVNHVQPIFDCCLIEIHELFTLPVIINIKKIIISHMLKENMNYVQKDINGISRKLIKLLCLCVLQ